MEERDWYTLWGKKDIDKAVEVLYISSRLKQIEGAIRRMRMIDEQCSHIKSEARGSLRIGSPPLFTRYKLPELLRQFKKQCPHVELKVTTKPPPEIADLMCNCDVHVGFVQGSFNWSDRMDLLSEDHIYIVSAQEFRIEDLPQMPLIHYELSSVIQDAHNAWWKERFSKPPIIGMEVDNAEFCKEMVIKGLGYAFLPGLLVNDTDPLYKIPVTYNTGKSSLWSTWMFYHSDNLNLATVKTFVDFVNNIYKF